MSEDGFGKGGIKPKHSPCRALERLLCIARFPLMVFLRRQNGRFRSLTFALIGALLSWLGLPQVGTLHHDHPGGQHAHIHLELQFPILAHHHHAEPLSYHGHHAKEHGSPEACGERRGEVCFARTRASGEPGHTKGSQTNLVYTGADPARDSHWHTYSALTRTRLTPPGPAPLDLPCQSFKAHARLIFFSSTLAVFQPRGPPAFL